MIERFPWGATCVCLCGVIVLVALGCWQLERLTWKNNLQAMLDVAYAKDASLTQLTESDFADSDKNHMARGSVPVSLDLGKLVFLNGHVLDGKPAKAIVAVATSPRLSKALMVEIGCVDAKSPAVKLSHIKKIEAKGLVRLPHWSYFTPQNKIGAQDWWRLDVRDFKTAFGDDFYERFLTLENAADINKDLAPCAVDHQLRNDHFSYAIFWFIMAGVLTAMWGLRFLRPYLQSA